MGKFKPARKDKKKKSAPSGAVPCVLLVISGMVLLSLLFYAILKSS